MKRQTTYGRGFLRAAAPWASCAAVLGASGTTALATATFNAGASSAVVVHNSGGGANTSAGVAISSGSAANTYGTGTPKKDKIFGGGTDSTTAKAGAGQTSSASQALLLLPSGMGNDQVDSTSPFTGASFVDLAFTLVWDITGTTFAPSNTAFNVTVGGTVGSGGSTKFEAVCRWHRKQGATTFFDIRPAYTPAAATFATAGSYLHSFNSGPSAISVPAGWQLIMTGSIKMSADDPMDPSVMDFISRGNNSGIPGAPIDCGVVIVPDAADSSVTWAGQDGNWSDPALWTGNGGDVPFHPTDHVLLDQGNPASSHVALDMNASVSDVQLDAGDTLDVQPGNALGLFGPNPSSFVGTFSNNGSVKLLNGTTANVTGTGTHSGAFSIDAGSTLQFAGGTNVLAAGSSITGDGGIAVTGGTLILNGTSTHTGPTGVAGGTLVVGNGDALGADGPLVISGGGTVQANADLSKAISVASVTTSTGGKFNLTNNSMVIKGMTGPQVQALLQAGYNGGAWNGPTGIVSSTVASTETSVGFATQAQLGVTEFKGVSGLAGTDVLVKYTYAGDANLDGKVDIGDLGLLAGAWQQLTGKVWFDGDFTYDGAVDIGDLGMLAGNWQKGTVGNPNPPLMDFNTALAQFSAFEGVVVPEPASLAVLGLGGLALGRRRRDRRNGVK